MKATLFAFLPIAFLASCTKNATTAQPPIAPAPVAGQTTNPYGVPGQSEVGQYTPDAAPYQPVQPINPPALPNSPPPVLNTTNVPPRPTVATPTVGGGTHTVVKGDSLWGLSRKYGVSADAIRQVNGMAPGDNIIRTGQSLQIPGR